MRPSQVFKKRKALTFERTYAAPIDAVWKAWTHPELLREWWAPDKTTIAESEIDLRVDGRIYIVMGAGEGMGKYQGTRWPLEGTFTHIEPPRSLAYDARSWTRATSSTSPSSRSPRTATTPWSTSTSRSTRSARAPSSRRSA